MSSRKYLTSEEVEAMINSVPEGEFYYRDRCLIMMSYIHGLRVSELKNIKIGDIDIKGKNIYISRLKNGLSTIHPLQPQEIEAISQWLYVRKYWLNNELNYFFLSRNGTPISRQQVYSLIKKYGKMANLPVSVHPHMLRHACGFKLADNGIDTRLIQDYLGHRNIQHTVHYTASNQKRFKSIKL